MNHLIADLIEVGLSANQAKAYFSLLTNSELSASELAKVSRIPRTRIYDVLEVLVKKGLCVEKHDRIRHYRAIRPAEALGILDKELAAKRELLLKLTDTLDKLYLMENRQEDPLLCMPKQTEFLSHNTPASSGLPLHSFLCGARP